MNDIAAETLVNLKTLSRRFPSARRGRSVHIATIRRWVLKGIAGVKLGTVKIGGTVYTSEQEFGRWRLAVQMARARRNEVSPHVAAMSAAPRNDGYERAKRINDWLAAGTRERRR